MKPIKKQITQKEIARIAGIGPDFLSHIIRERCPCPKKVAVRLEEITGEDRRTWVFGSFEQKRQAIEKFMYPER